VESPPTTYLEAALGDILSSLHLRYLREYWIGHHWVDFVLQDFYLAIEADGRLFHGDTLREDRRDEELKRHGWDVTHVFGPNIINERKLVTESIKQDVRRAHPRPIKLGEVPRQDVIAEWDLPKPKPKPRKHRRRYHHASVLDEPAQAGHLFVPVGSVTPRDLSAREFCHRSRTFVTTVAGPRLLSQSRVRGLCDTSRRVIGHVTEVHDLLLK